jgi:uncharacterized protein YeaO (DUF488 family)
MKIKIKRAYEKPGSGDGVRVLADRLWPRGLTKRSASVHAWVKELAPSAGLRTWYHMDREARWVEFKKRYRRELNEHRELISNFQNTYNNSTVTLVSANKDISTSHVPILMAFLNRKNT